MAGSALSVGYRRSAVIRAGVPAVLLPLAAGYSAFSLRDDAPWIVAVALAIFAFVTCVFVPLFGRAVVRCLRGAPLLTIAEDGVTLHSARVGLPWSNVAQIRIDHQPGRADLLVFVPVDAGQAVEALRGTPRRFARSAESRFGGPIFVRADQLDRPVDEVLTAIRGWTSAPVRHRPVPRRRLAGV